MADGGRIGAFGPVAFETSAALIRTFEDLREQRRSRWAVHDVLALEQRLQYLGQELSVVTLAMAFHVNFCDPAAELDALRAVVADHQAHALVVGGVNLGDYVAERLGTTWRHVANNGVLLQATAEVELREYH